MPDHRQRTPFPISVTTTISAADFAKLEARAAIQGISRTEVLRNLGLQALSPENSLSSLQPSLISLSCSSVASEQT
jgi:hypothetical protein